MALKYSTEWDIHSYYDETEPEEHWLLRKQFMKVHKGKFPEEYLVAFSKALTNIDLFASLYSSLIGTVKYTNQSDVVDNDSDDNEPNVHVAACKEDVKLHESENPWKPTTLKPAQNVNNEEEKTIELYRKVRGVLNKLTPQKFNTLISQVKILRIDTKDRLQGVVDLMFEKAIKEPKFADCYALMCKHLSQIQVPEPQRKKDGDFANFRKLMITRCQMEFEKNSTDDTKRNQLVQLIDSCEDAEKKKELLGKLEEYDRDLQLKAVGIVKFIGELFKQGMLTVNIMMRCLNDLIEKRDAQHLERLCKLLITVGKELQEKRENLNPIFNKMKDIVDKKHGKVSSRICFMLQDVIDLKKKNWVPRRQDTNQKTIDI